MRPVRIVPAVLAAISLAACAPSAGPVEIPADQLPVSLARTPEPFPEGGGASAIVYLVKGGRLVRVLRPVPSDVPASEAAVRALLEGPTNAERADGVETAVPSATQLLRVRVVQGVAQVDLSDEFQGPATPDIVLLRLAQVVWTMASVPDVVAVRFAIEGEAIGVLTDDQAVTDGPVSALDYAVVAPVPDA